MKKSTVEIKVEIAEKLKNKKLRRCYSLHACCLCNSDIKDGDLYYDGGLKSRAHHNCVGEVLYDYGNPK